MLFSVFGVGWAEIVVLTFCSGILIFVPVALILVLGLSGGRNANADQKRAADRMATDTDAADAADDRRPGKIDKDTRFEKDESSND